jgi:hypothetical protein
MLAFNLTSRLSIGSLLALLASGLLLRIAR